MLIVINKRPFVEFFKIGRPRSRGWKNFVRRWRWGVGGSSTIG